MIEQTIYTVKPLDRGHLGGKEKVPPIGGAPYLEVLNFVKIFEILLSILKKNFENFQILKKLKKIIKND